MKNTQVNLLSEGILKILEYISFGVILFTFLFIAEFRVTEENGYFIFVALYVSILSSIFSFKYLKERFKK